ncbi:hypothetical protein BCV73_02130 [Paenibacillus sp. SSG-1]|uniref:Na-translocating system protein MpsC family protein n=1 Tax=unclassified Paenibacillus TaxID=185978 RepID=UPI000B7CA55C|nr:MULTISPECIES: Na-translocating system protein MpsC family protein [unclassified Paenibacillus]OXL82001.1 hypothetical protein BCV73_02130 [Paenibacillus sp. SSG-1]UYO04409.1 DUF2294 domain-containing protein [Paenibacillus sp. PSB04]
MLYTANHTNQIAAFTGKLLRDRFGKGPESVHVSVGNYGIALHIRNFIGPVERFLLNKEEEKAFRYTRELLMESLLPELKAYLEKEMDIRLEEVYYDWGLHNASGIIVGLKADQIIEAEDYAGRDALHNEVNRVTGIVQKVPRKVYSWWMNPKTLIVVREGLLILIEKELINTGFDEVLRTTKRKLEKRYFEEETQLGGILGRTLADFYVDWDFDRDKSVIACTFQD